MSIKEICDLKVPFNDNAILFLWGTAPKMLEAFQVMEAWGFSYKSQAIWDKQILGMGYWFRGQHEILLVGTKGKMSPPPQSLRVGSVLSFRRTKHSRKPPEIRDMIASWYPDLKKVELFAREKTDHFDTWGNEVPNDVEIDTGEEIVIRNNRIF